MGNRLADCDSIMGEGIWVFGVSYLHTSPQLSPTPDFLSSSFPSILCLLLCYEFCDSCSKTTKCTRGGPCNLRRTRLSGTNEYQNHNERRRTLNFHHPIPKPPTSLNDIKLQDELHLLLKTNKSRGLTIISPKTYASSCIR